MSDIKNLISRILLLWTCFLFMPATLPAQELTVKSLEQLHGDVTACSEEYQRKDLNDDFAGIVKVMVPLDSVEFDGGMLLDQKKKGDGEYWVWLAKDATKLIVRGQGFLPLEVNFRDFSLVVRPQTTYRLVISKPTVPMPSSASSITFSSFLSPDGKVQTFMLNGVSFRMLQVEGGTFRMGGTAEQGSDSNQAEQPVHDVTLDSFLIGETEVTQELWEVVMNNNPSEFKGAKHPVEKVNWDDCYVFIDKLNALTNLTFRLPTEAEWEFAARGGTKSRRLKYSGSQNLDEVAWFDANSNDTTHPVGTKEGNELGIYDMSGNVFEWCEDRGGPYSSSAQTNPTGAPTGFSQICRGGCWLLSPKYSRVSDRAAFSPDERENCIGFRLAL